MKFDLETRKGLPAELRILADKYPKAMWNDHPNFNELTSFWLERHGMFRSLIAKITDMGVDKLENRTHKRFAPDLSRYSGFFLNQLHGHHSIEDEHYFPQFTKLDKRLVRGFEILDRDHHSLDAHIHAFATKTNAVLQAIQSGDKASNAYGALHETHLKFATFLERHLQDEEEIIVPLILEYGADLQG